MSRYPKPLPGETCKQWIARVDRWRQEKQPRIAEALAETRRKNARRKP